MSEFYYNKFVTGSSNKLFMVSTSFKSSTSITKALFSLDAFSLLLSIRFSLFFLWLKSVGDGGSK